MQTEHGPVPEAGGQVTVMSPMLAQVLFGGAPVSSVGGVNAPDILWAESKQPLRVGLTISVGPALLPVQLRLPPEHAGVPMNLQLSPPSVQKESLVQSSSVLHLTVLSLLP